MFTSGSTGNPKGVVITNDSLNNMISIYDIKDGSLSFLEMPIAGGEPVPTKLAMQINYI